MKRFTKSDFFISTSLPKAKRKSIPFFIFFDKMSSFKKRTLFSSLSGKKRLDICAGPPNVGAKWSRSWWAGGWVGGGAASLAQRELDTNLPIQARTATENKQITNNYLPSQIQLIPCRCKCGPCPEHISWERTRTTRIALTSVE